MESLGGGVCDARSLESVTGDLWGASWGSVGVNNEGIGGNTGCLESVMGEGEYSEVCEVRDRAVLLNDGALWAKRMFFPAFRGYGMAI